MTCPQISLLVLLLSGVVPAMAEDAAPQPAPRSAYRNVMAAQYAAQVPPTNARPDEAKAIYDSYIKRIGQPARDRNDLSNRSGTNTGISSR